MVDPKPNQGSNNVARFFAVFLILMAFWVVFSGKLDAFHLSLGAICCALVSWASADLLIKNFGGQNRLMKTLRFLAYAPWLIYQVILSNFHVVALVINPSKIHPQIVRFKSKLKSDFSNVTLANSITLTPGTITMDIENGNEFVVHALSKKVADDLLSGEMEKRVAHMFFETE
jgi:multicomponent Na+:H+ antiporter subunit E